MNRREFARSMMTLAATTALSRIAVAEHFADESSAIARLYGRAIVIDTLCSPFAMLDREPTASQIAEIRGSGITAINTTITGSDFQDVSNNLDALESLVKAHPDLLMFVERLSDIGRAKQEKKTGIIRGFQQTTFLEDAPERIEHFRKRGVRIMQLTYNKRSAFGDGCLEPENRGLTDAGRKAVATMNQIAVAVDLSHSGYRTTSEGIAASKKPVLISHSGCAAVYAHPRNKPDEILKALADRGGYFGVYLMPYLVASPTVPTREHVLDHLVHAINVCGAEHVGVGSDGPIEKVTLSDEQKKEFEADIARRKAAGIGAPGEDRYPYVPDLTGPHHMLDIAEGLAKRGQKSSVIEKVLGANFQRVLGEIWGQA